MASCQFIQEESLTTGLWYTPALPEKCWRPQLRQATEQSEKQKKWAWFRPFGRLYPICKKLWGPKGIGHACWQLPQQWLYLPPPQLNPLKRSSSICLAGSTMCLASWVGRKWLMEVSLHVSFNALLTSPLNILVLLCPFVSPSWRRSLMTCGYSD